MPRGDRTGPLGAGPMTGRAAGYCTGFGVPGYMGFAPGGGLGRGFGRGRGFWRAGFGGGGWRHWFYSTGLPGWMPFGGSIPPVQKPDPQLEKQALQNQAKNLQSELDFIQKRLNEMESSSEAEEAD